MPPAERAVVLMALMRDLEGVMRAENALLRDMRLERLRAVQEEKSALAETFEVELRRLRAAPEAVGALGPAAREELDGAMRRFRAAAQANGRRLEAGRRIVEGVVRALGESASGACGSGAYRPGPPVAGGGRVVSLGLDRRA